ncbi:UDP-3-O-acyl-N-acetylglucosamine deacetylase [Pelagibacterium luteolum]|uniref:UDP-3-O-acyl-N-acetylglucosamine deacetylase n=1 Tax=Pelagibacterium luteolum TaxID=440168 RepID=A0A1G7UV89_9HYPH|nr:UDP-3-O-acyl-N-acetylglucosamine deacetylase [Pelagibacterium luteolum]SDG51443.1 UDP-3-O-[3-hydroxymyristoyl] N-acetylglucosamine deacetylase [Pelagibacterium luteolum]
MTNYSVRQCTLSRPVEFAGIGVHNGSPSRLAIKPAPADSGYILTRLLEDGTIAGRLRVEHDRVTRTSLCTVIDLGQSVSIATVEHVLAALSGLGIDNAEIVVTGEECPIVDGSAEPFVRAILEVGLLAQAPRKKFLRILRTVTVRDNDAFAMLEPYNGRAFDVEIDFNSKVIGRQRMIFDWSPRRFAEDVAPARTFGFVAQAKVLRQAGYALGSSLENSIAIEEERIVNPDGLRFRDEFVRHKLLDAVGDLALAGQPIYGRFKSYKGGHGLNALVLKSLFASENNYEIVDADALPLEMEALADLPETLTVAPYLRSIG